LTYQVILHDGAGVLQQMKKRSRAARSSIPAPYVRLMLELGAKWGLDEAQVLAGTGISATAVHDPEARFSSQQSFRLVRNIVRLSGREGIGFEFGLYIKPTAHGFLGYAVMGSATLRNAAELLQKYLRLRLSDITLMPTLEGSTVVVTTVDAHPLGPLRHAIYEAFFTMLYRHGCFLAGVEREPGVEFCFDWPEPPYFADYREQLPTVRFSQPANQLRIPLALLDKAVLTADSAAVRQSLQAMERELAELGTAPENIVARVRGELKPDADGYPSLDAVAARLHVSSSTLKRRLQAGGTRFQDLLDEVRRQDALRLMRNSSLELQEIGRLLGFSDPACFTRAFRRWTQQTPSAWRQQQS